MEDHHKTKEELVFELQNLQQITHPGSFHIDLTTNKVTWNDETY
jgi:hypothetical protein